MTKQQIVELQDTMDLILCGYSVITDRVNIAMNDSTLDLEDPYMLGLINGLRQAKALLEGREYRPL